MAILLDMWTLAFDGNLDPILNSTQYTVLQFLFLYGFYLVEPQIYWQIPKSGFCAEMGKAVITHLPFTLACC